MRTHPMSRRTRIQSPRRQQGVVLMIALIVLVAMTLAALGIIRATDTGSMVAGNIGFRQATLASGDSGIEAARTWLIANRLTLESDQPTRGYYATRQDNLDLTGNQTATGADGVDWAGSDPSRPAKAISVGNVDSSGNDVLYIIHRLCSIVGSPNAPSQSCATASQSGIGSSQDAPDYSTYALKVKNQIYYRVTSRVNGPKNTVSYVQAVILL